jgi:hypothetical protein
MVSHAAIEVIGAAQPQSVAVSGSIGPFHGANTPIRHTPRNPIRQRLFAQLLWTLPPGLSDGSLRVATTAAINHYALFNLCQIYATQCTCFIIKKSARAHWIIALNEIPNTIHTLSSKHRRWTYVAACMSFTWPHLSSTHPHCFSGLDSSRLFLLLHETNLPK